MIKLISDHLKTKMYKNSVKKSPFVIRYVTDRYNTRKMYNKSILENCGSLVCVPDQYKTQEMYDKAADNYTHALEFVLDFYMA